MLSVVLSWRQSPSGSLVPLTPYETRARTVPATTWPFLILTEPKLSASSPGIETLALWGINFEFKDC